MFEAIFQIGSDDLQPLYQHVNHARILSLLEKARENFMEAIGHPLHTLIARGYFVVVTRIEVQYRREVLSGSVRITCEQGRLEGRVLSMRQRLFNQRSKEAVCAVVELMAIEQGRRRAGDFPEDFAASLRAFFEGRPCQQPCPAGTGIARR